MDRSSQKHCAAYVYDVCVANKSLKTKTCSPCFYYITPVAGSNLHTERISRFSELSSEFKFWRSFLSNVCGVDYKSPHIFERLFSKKKPTRKSPRGWSVVKFREFGEKSAEMNLVAFTRLLGLLWKKLLEFEFLRRVRRIKRHFLRANLILRSA